MCPEHRPPRRAQSGFALPAAIFLVVILAALGAFILVVFSYTTSAQTMDILGVRAYQAARAGIEWGAFRALTPASAPACPSATLSFPAGTTLQDFTTTVACTLATADEAGTTVSVYRFTATACNQPPCPNAAPGQNYVERQLAATVAR